VQLDAFATVSEMLIEAIEPDSAMLRYARERVKTAPVPINLTQAAVEYLPAASESFDSVVCTLVLCSVTDPLRGLLEIHRVLKAGGMLLVLEHVRAHGHIISTLQDMATPFTRRFAGNCHWNRDTEQTVQRTGFRSVFRRELEGGLLPMVMLRVSK
jgi:ubiquinone/menaquinone biosynthesis C-methylase UbiE